MAVRVSSSPTLSRPFVELFWKMLDFSTKWPTKFAGKVSKCRHNENCCEGRGPGIIFEHFVRALLQAYCNSGGAKYEPIPILRWWPGHAGGADPAGLECRRQRSLLGTGNR